MSVLFAALLVLNASGIVTSDTQNKIIGSMLASVGCLVYLWSYYRVIEAYKAKAESPMILGQMLVGLVLILGGFVLGSM